SLRSGPEVLHLALYHRLESCQERAAQPEPFPAGPLSIFPSTTERERIPALRVRGLCDPARRSLRPPPVTGIGGPDRRQAGGPASRSVRAAGIGREELRRDCRDYPLQPGNSEESAQPGPAGICRTHRAVPRLISVT